MTGGVISAWESIMPLTPARTIMMHAHVCILAYDVIAHMHRHVYMHTSSSNKYVPRASLEMSI